MDSVCPSVKGCKTYAYGKHHVGDKSQWRFLCFCLLCTFKVAIKHLIYFMKGGATCTLDFMLFSIYHLLEFPALFLVSMK